MPQPQKPAAPVQNRRRVPRFPFSAAAQLHETSSGKTSSVRTTDLSLYGCYVQMHNPPEQGAHVTIKIFTDTDFFEAPATVAFSQLNVGAGLAFHDVNPHYLPTLKKWLTAALQEIAKKENSE